MADAMVLSCFCLSFYFFPTHSPPPKPAYWDDTVEVFFVMLSVLQHMAISIHRFLVFVLLREETAMEWK